MKGIIVKALQKEKISFDPYYKLEWEVEYKDESGIKRLPLHQDDWQFAEEGKEIQFEINHSTPLHMGFGQEQYSGILQRFYGPGARIIRSEVRHYLNSVITKEEYEKLKSQHEEGCKNNDYSKMMIGDENDKKIKLYERQFCKHSRIVSHQGGQIDECLQCGKTWG